MLTCWLDSPYAEVFYSPPEFDDLNYLYSVGSHWLNVFADVLPSTHLTQTSRSSSKRKTSVEYVSKAKVAVMSITKPQQVDLAYNFERLCHKIGSLLERYCLNAGLFKEVLFSNVFPPDCLNYVRQRPAPTIEPTIKQFNQVYRLVITTILESPPNSHSQVSSFFDNPSFASTLALTSASVSFTGNYLRRGEAVTSQALKAAVVDAAVESSQQQESGLAQRTDRIAKIYPAHHQRLEALAQLLSLEDNQKNARELLDHVKMEHGRVFAIFRNLSFAPHLMEEGYEFCPHPGPAALVDFRWDCIGSLCCTAGNLLHGPDSFCLGPSSGLKSEPHLGDDEAVIGPTIDIADRLGYQHVLSISPPDENIVQQLPAPRPMVHPRGLLPRRKAEEGVGQQETVFRTRAQKKEAVIVTATETVGTQHSLPGSVVRPGADIEVTKDN
ncbi:unnamed protein product [Schistocephalus solidus]|uniref:Uncharacterized protein n=1 Tax=Schistocephalus solidus TaxID=70667 RepID=A0A3P7C8H4_SCHSO|nr:unnamed protein product [Schistocephalus solidus]